MSLFQILDYNPCDSELVQVLISAIKVVFTIIQWGIPLILMVMCTIDLFKAVSSGDEKKTKEVQKTCIRRLIYAVVAFLVPTIISLVFGFIGQIVDTNDGAADKANAVVTDFFVCWNGDTTSKYVCCANSSCTITMDAETKEACSGVGGSWQKEN